MGLDSSILYVKEAQAAEDGVQSLNDKKDRTKDTLERSCVQSKHGTSIDEDSNDPCLIQVSTALLD